MLFLVSYRNRVDGSTQGIKLRKNIFAEHEQQPSLEQAEALVNQVSGGNFAQASIQLQKCQGFDADELRRTGITVFRFGAEQQKSGVIS